MTAPWWAGFGPAQAEVSCGDGTHTLRWADGTLVAADHPDAEGELVLAALGGDTTPCLEVVRAWGQHSDNLAVLAIGPRSAADKLTITTEMLDELAPYPAAPGGGFISVRSYQKVGRATVRRSAPMQVSGLPPAMQAARLQALKHAVRASPLQPSARPAALIRAVKAIHPSSTGVSDDRASLLRLFALGEPFQWRLSGAVAHAWSAGGEHADRHSRARPALTAALTWRLAPAVAQWLDVDPASVEAAIHDGAGWGALELSSADGVNRVRARLPVSWLATVWAPGFAVVGSHLVVRVLDAAWPAARVLALRAPGTEPAELSIRQDTGHWSVAAR